ncbi:hypothetical protein [Nocardia iowensis]|uniref:Uncharacterized protein n=1 Tax=Nocardia iowensis TaxID=204891 RepID=A0ABX8RL51_NOCIO|nr:hypothetical protein [Nocardia iowensis]QXN90325.1 hypothetical protein KV110_33695 [Nocardia iowensis]
MTLIAADGGIGGLADFTIPPLCSQDVGPVVAALWAASCAAIRSPTVAFLHYVGRVPITVM